MGKHHFRQSSVCPCSAPRDDARCHCDTAGHCHLYQHRHTDICTPHSRSGTLLLIASWLKNLLQYTYMHNADPRQSQLNHTPHTPPSASPLHQLTHNDQSMFPCRQCQTGVVRLAEETEVLLHPLVVQEGSPVLWVGTTGAGADRGEDDKVCLDTWWEGGSTPLTANHLSTLQCPSIQ